MTYGPTLPVTCPSHRGPGPTGPVNGARLAPAHLLATLHSVILPKISSHKSNLSLHKSIEKDNLSQALDMPQTVIHH